MLDSDDRKASDDGGESEVWLLDRNALCRMLARDSEAYLLGKLAEQIDARHERVPVWAWTNLLAHGSEGDLVAERRSPITNTYADEVTWREARSYLAGEVVDLSEVHGPLDEIQRKVLVPLELELASNVEVEWWNPAQWVKAVRRRLAEYRLALDRAELRNRSSPRGAHLTAGAAVGRGPVAAS